jgi:predicted thioesterase
MSTVKLYSGHQIASVICMQIAYEIAHEIARVIDPLLSERYLFLSNRYEVARLALDLLLPPAMKSVSSLTMVRHIHADATGIEVQVIKVDPSLVLKTLS